jgi:hypothetical protein
MIVHLILNNIGEPEPGEGVMLGRMGKYTTPLLTS